MSSAIDAVEEVAVRKAFRRLIGFLALMMFCAVMDRVNVGFAALSMNKDLGLSSFSFGLGASLFSLGYMLFEIPSNLMLARVGARLWFMRIMVTWALLSMATSLATGPMSFYVLRFLLGVAEAGLFPGILFFLGCWFPGRVRARTNAVFLIAMPLGQSLTALLSGPILEMNGLWGLHGWQWLFILEGLPTLFIGIAAWFYLSDRPREARWLSPAEQEALENMVQREKVTLGKLDTSNHLAVFGDRHVVALGVLYALISIVLTGVPLWLPQIVRTLDLSYAVVGVLVAIPPLLGTLAMVFWGRSSDRKGERIWHIACAMLTCAVGWLLAVGYLYFGWGGPWLLILGLVVANAGVLGAIAVFWTLPALILSGTAAASGIAFVSAVGNIGSIIGPIVFGHLRDISQGFAGPSAFMMAIAAMAGIFLPALVGVLPKLSQARSKADRDLQSCAPVATKR
ncbi:MULTISPECIES: MFS transporter [unclassified Beijerinckia]|uniref:MFS transporter n=1 Tax=unclassified Beijerinckia TaxID=2638183 RepID=UPI00089D5A4F|nr:MULTISPECIES: MFS transporter [unclassified Beijerinckia]MDH7796566.1 ACS family tartrate transporter-like MFS transporter [Beijerinckia sp. GAS462]SEC50574.1 MFS transporter, ACS family, tartrate transporter [Beijerinckia sp. 28-YEA-48]